jgi:paraquat-inducible protein B
MRKYNAPRVKESRGVRILTTIWLVPFIALIIALWLGYQYYIKIGSTIQISFKSNAGLVENQSPIKMRDVTVGIVKKISLSHSGEGVVIKARMNKEIGQYLNTKAKFWIVHPDVGSNGISGLDTIVSGSYIELRGKKETETTHHYIGLEEIPMDDDAKGSYQILSAPQGYNIREGSHIYYRMMDVGRVERVGISPDGSHVNFTVFIKEQYKNYVNSKSKFYTSSAFNIDFSKGNLDMTLAPFSQLLKGGISIYTPQSSFETNNTIKKGTIFHLYKSLAQMKAKQLGVGGEERVYQLSFTEPTDKLKIGSSIEFQGFQVGHITQIEDRYDTKTKTLKSDIYALLNIEAFSTKELNSSQKEKILPKLIAEGLKAKLSTPLPVIGSQFIELVFDKSKRGVIGKQGKYSLLPTIINQPTEDIMGQVQAFLTKLQNLPLKNLLLSANGLINENRKPITKLLKDLDKTVLNLNGTVESLATNLNTTVDNLNTFTSDEEFKQLPQSLNSSLYELEQTLKELKKLSHDYSGDSKFADQLSVTFKEVSEAAQAFEKINQMLDRNANALVIGDD